MFIGSVCTVDEGKVKDNMLLQKCCFATKQYVQQTKHKNNKPQSNSEYNNIYNTYI